MSASTALSASVIARIDAGDAHSVRAALADVGVDELRRLGREARRLLDDDDVSYQPAGSDHATRWRLDPVPLVLDADEWATIDRGVVQRAELYNLVLADLYGPRDLIRTGRLPPEVVFAHPGFLRALDRVRLPGFHQLTIAATDLMRRGDGTWTPVSDRTQVPSGATYALENRSVLSRLLPDLHRAARVERLAPYVRALRSALRAAAPAHVEEPRIAVLSGGADTAFEHGNIAGLLGYPVAEGPDLSVRDGRLWLRSLSGEAARIDVLLRRVDAWWCDPLELRADSALGVAGLVEANRRGGVSLVNALGAGVLENPGLQAFLPSLCQALLGQDLRLTPARTLWCGDSAARDEVLGRLGDIVVKPIARTTAADPLDTARMSAGQRDQLRARIQANPHRWVGQDHIDGQRERSLSPDGSLVDARLVLRTFAVASGGTYTTLRGGLTRVSDADRSDLGRTHNAWSKDTWVLGGDREVAEDFWLHRGPRLAADAPESVVSARVVQNMLWLGRYAERAEATVRLLRAIDDRRAEAGGGTPALDAVVDRLLVALSEVTRTTPGFGDEQRRRRPDPELTSLVLDAPRTGSVAHSTGRLLDAARAAREQLSSDAWPVLTSLERQLLGDGETAAVLATGARGPAYGRGALAHVLTLLLALHGLGGESLVRDPSWQFLEAGRRLERAQQLLGLLRATVARLEDVEREVDSGAATSLLLESVLVTCESVITYRRRYRSRAQLATVLELLLLDHANPRSLQWQLDRLLDVLPQLTGRGDDGRLSPVEEAIHTARSALRSADVDELTSGHLTALLERLDRQMQRAGSELARIVFVPPPTQRPLVEERTGTAGDVLLA